MAGTPRQTFRVEEYIWRKFKKKCEREGYTASEVLRACITSILEGRLKISDLKPTKVRRGVKMSEEDFYSAFLKWLKKVK